MKIVWMYTMFGSMGIFITAFTFSLFRLADKGLDWLVIFLGIVSAIFFLISVLISTLVFYKIYELEGRKDE